MGFWTALFSPAANDPPKSRARRPASDAIVPRIRTSSSGIEYRLERARRKSIGLIITADGLLIRAPSWTPLYEIDAAICERQTWIANALARQQARRAQLAQHRDGGHVLFRGNKLKLELRPGLFESLDLSDSHCIVTTTGTALETASAFAASALDEEFKRIAKHELPALAHQMAADAQLPLKSVSISSARTMWGSCTSDGRVRLNFRLIQLAPNLMRHVVAHELAHLVEFNHSKRFWSIVEQLDPETRAHKRAIKGYAVLLEL